MRIQEIIDIIMITRESFGHWIFILPVLIFCTIYVKRRKGRIIGYLAYGFKTIYYFAIAKKHRSKGHGSKLLKRALSKVKEIMVSPKNKRAIKLYRRFGFKKKKIIINAMLRKRVLMVVD